MVTVVRGKQNAEATVKELENSESSADRHEGWRYFIEKTEMKAGTDPAEATRRRQADLDKRESKAIEETNPPIIPSQDPRR